MDKLQLHTPTEGTPVLLAATKLDIFDEKNPEHMSANEVESFIEEFRLRFPPTYSVDFIKTSARDCTNVNNMLAEIGDQIYNWMRIEGYIIQDTDEV